MTPPSERRVGPPSGPLDRKRLSLSEHDFRTVGQVMVQPVFTVRATDRIERAADLMEWKHIRHVPVEDDEGFLVGIVTYRTLLHLLGLVRNAPVPVGEVMKALPVTVTPNTKLLDALRLMRDGEIGCLPVIDPDNHHGPKLVGIITGSDFIALSADLLEDWLNS